MTPRWEFFNVVAHIWILNPLTCIFTYMKHSVMPLLFILISYFATSPKPLWTKKIASINGYRTPWLFLFKWFWLWDIICSVSALSPFRNMCFVIQALGSTQHKQSFNASVLIVSSNQRRSSETIKCKLHSSSFEVNSSWTLLCGHACRQRVTDSATILLCLSLQ